MPELRMLNLSSNVEQRWIDKALIKGLGQLESLSLSQMSSLSRLPDTSEFAHLLRLQPLEIGQNAFGQLLGFRFRLSVQNTQIRHFPPEALKHLVGVNFLRLFLRNNHLNQGQNGRRKFATKSMAKRRETPTQHQQSSGRRGSKGVAAVEQKMTGNSQSTDTEEDNAGATPQWERRMFVCVDPPWLNKDLPPARIWFCPTLLAISTPPASVTKKPETVPIGSGSSGEGWTPKAVPQTSTLAVTITSSATTKIPLYERPQPIQSPSSSSSSTHTITTTTTTTTTSNAALFERTTTQQPTNASSSSSSSSLSSPSSITTTTTKWAPFERTAAQPTNASSSSSSSSSSSLSSSSITTTTTTKWAPFERTTAQPTNASSSSSSSSSLSSNPTTKKGAVFER
ncbi:hypothetical protein niasHT_014006 [Heterodera trifolii]|uniref:Uncharacterized protein n=1 Tax=Heterodera trifolii TaxID=157864 RepID=A0ABD2KXH1_9BILA